MKQTLPFWQRHLPLLVTGTILAAGTVSYTFLPPFRDFLREGWATLTSNDEAAISRWVSQFGWRGPLLLVAAMILQIFLIIIPSWGLMVVAVLAYGPVWGTALSLVATTVAAAVAYVFGKYVGDVAVENLVGAPNLRKAEGWVREHGFWAVVLARLSPVISGDAVSLVSGLTEMGLLRFLAATALGAAPLAMAIGYFGENTDELKQGFLWISAVSGLVFVGYLVWKRREKV